MCNFDQIELTGSGQDGVATALLRAQSQTEYWGSGRDRMFAA
jgi:hypothetical protein